jgi:hypothetical protein
MPIAPVRKHERTTTRPWLAAGDCLRVTDAAGGDRRRLGEHRERSETVGNGNEVLG